MPPPALHNRPPIVFDIETGPAPDAAEFAPDFDAPSNYKDPVKIAAYKVEKLDEWIKAAALSPITGRILAIGLREDGQSTILCDDDEAVMLRGFWFYVAPDGVLRAPMIGFCSNRFDLPYIIRRSWRHGVAVPWGIMNGRYLNNAFIDLAVIWQVGDYQATVKLDVLARWLGVGAKNGDGADFAALLATDRAKALEYLENDLVLTEGCAIRLGAMVTPASIATSATEDY